MNFSYLVVVIIINAPDNVPSPRRHHRQNHSSCRLCDSCEMLVPYSQSIISLTASVRPSVRPSMTLAVVGASPLPRTVRCVQLADDDDDDDERRNEIISVAVIPPTLLYVVGTFGALGLS